MRGPVTSVEILRVQDGGQTTTSDLVASEEPLEIRLKYWDGIAFREKRLAVTMRTPGHDFELAIGFLFTEGIIKDYTVVEKIFYCEDVKPEESGNVVIVHLRKTVMLDETVFSRNFYINSSCGVCGKSSLDSIRTFCEVQFSPGFPMLDHLMIERVTTQVKRDQSAYRYTGGLHAAALLNTQGNLQMLREDIGRHNALDKLIGARLIAGQSNTEMVLFLSGRAGFELVQKAVVAGIPIVIAVGAPSSLGVDVARGFDQTLIGFAREGKFNIYSGKHRIR